MCPALDGGLTDFNTLSNHLTYYRLCAFFVCIFLFTLTYCKKWGPEATNFCDWFVCPKGQILARLMNT